MSDIELSPCPFCGAQARTFKWESRVTGKEFFRTACDAENPPGCDAEPFVDGDTEAEAIAAWNRRASDPLAAELVEALDALLSPCGPKDVDDIDRYLRESEEIEAKARALLAKVKT